MKKAITALALSASMCQSASAGPDETTEFLMSRNVSMLDWGMHLTELDVQEVLIGNLSRDGTSVIARVIYNYNKDEITVHVRGRDYDAALSEDVRKLDCRYYMNTVREHAGVDLETGKLREYYEWSFFADHFKHNGFSYEGDEDRISEIDKKIVIVVGISTTVCRGDLLSNNILFLES